MLPGTLRSFLVINYSAICSLVLAVTWGAIMEHVREVRLRVDPTKRSRLILGWAILACCALDTLIFGQDTSEGFTIHEHFWDTSRHRRTAQPVLSVPQSVQELAACALLLSMHDLEQVFFAGCFLWTANHLGARVPAMTPIFLKAAALLAISAAPAGAAIQLAWRLVARWRLLCSTNAVQEDERDERRPSRRSYCLQAVFVWALSMSAVANISLVLLLGLALAAAVARTEEGGGRDGGAGGGGTSLTGSGVYFAEFASAEPPGPALEFVRVASAVQV